MEINAIIEESRQRGLSDAVSGYDKADGADWFDLIDKVDAVMGWDWSDMPESEFEDAVAASRQITKQITDAYWQGWRQGHQQRGGGRTLPDLASILGVSYDTLAKAAREGRLEARKSGGVYLSSFKSIDKAIKVGTMRLNDKGRKALKTKMDAVIVQKGDCLTGKIGADEVTDPDVKAWLNGRLARQAKSDREHALMSLGYHQALLDHAGSMDLDVSEQQEIACIVAQLKCELGFEKP